MKIWLRLSCAVCRKIQCLMLIGKKILVRFIFIPTVYLGNNKTVIIELTPQSYLGRLHCFNMLATNVIWFYLCLMAVPQSISSIRVNTTVSDGKVVISGNHNEVTVSADRESKMALAQIKGRLVSVQKSNAGLLLQVQAIDQRLSALERKGTHIENIQESFV